MWTGEIDKDGYGKFPVRSGQGRRKRWMAHRYAYAHMVGPIPEGWEVDHTCRNRACVLPAHLEAVTQKVNHDRWVAAITHCRRAGHLYDAANTGRHTDGSRRCRACSREDAARVREADREAYNAGRRAYRERRKALVSA